MISWRAQRLIEKMLSIKFVIFIVATVLRCVGVIGNAEWLTVAMAVIAGREAQKVLGDRFQLSGRKKNDEESLGSD